MHPLAPMLLITVPQGTGYLDVSPGQPRVDVPVTLSLVTTAPPRQVSWDFGDGTPPSTGGPLTLHTFPRPGAYLVQALYPDATGSLIAVQRRLTVTEPRRLTLAPLPPSAGLPIRFTAEDFLGARVGWDFGDGTAPVLGESRQTHVFGRSGVYLVSARDLLRDPPRVFRLQVEVLGQGPSAVFTLSYLSLRWEDGTTETTVAQGETGPVALADFKCEGTGIFVAQWLVDGRPQGSPLTRTLAFAGQGTLDSAEGPAAFTFPTHLPGTHEVSLQVLKPTLAFPVPVLQYVVTLNADAPRAQVLSVTPTVVRAGEEAELTLTGRHFTDQLKLDLGPDAALTTPLRILGPSQAVARIFVAPSARPGFRILKALPSNRGQPATARLRILAPKKPLVPRR